MAREVLEELSDEGLVAQVKAGDEHAFAEVVRRYDQRLRVLAYGILADHAGVDDAVQEAYLRAFRALPRFRGDASLATWLHRIVHNICMDVLRRRRRSFALAATEDAPEVVWSGPGPAEVASTRLAIAEAVRRLEPSQQVVVRLVYGEGLDYSEVAALLDVPTGTVASRLSRARAGLRQSLDAA